MAKGDQLYYKALQLAGQQEYDTQEVISCHFNYFFILGLIIHRFIVINILFDTI